MGRIRAGWLRRRERQDGGRSAGRDGRRIGAGALLFCKKVAQKLLGGGFMAGLRGAAEVKGAWATKFPIQS